jgi:hypothetical protein
MRCEEILEHLEAFFRHGTAVQQPLDRRKMFTAHLIAKRNGGEGK